MSYLFGITIFRDLMKLSVTITITDSPAGPTLKQDRHPITPMMKKEELPPMTK